MLSEIVHGLVVVLTGIKQCLGGNAAYIETGAAEGIVPFNKGCFHAQLGAPDRAHVAAGPGTDNDYIKIFHTTILLRR